MQELVSLRLDSALQSARSFLGSVAFNAFQKVTLPHLTHLLICAPVLAMLLLVSVQLKTELRLTCDSELAYDSSGCLAAYSPLYPLLAQRFTTQENQALAVPTIRSLVLATAPRGLEVILGTSERDCNDMFRAKDIHWGSNIPLQVAVMFGETSGPCHIQHLF